MKPLVSVIMPCYNMEKYINDAINSILMQTYEHFELIVIDDGSTDASLEKVCSLKEQDNRIKIIENNTNRGIGYSRNQGILVSAGEYIALMDADDIAYPNRFEDQVAILEKNRDVDAVSGYYDYIIEDVKTENDSLLPELNAEEVAINLLFNCVISDSSMMFRKKNLVENNIMFPEDYRAVGAYKFWCEFALHGSIVVVPQKFYQYRINNEGLTQVTKRNNREERYGWHNKIHEYYWEANGVELTSGEKRILFDATNGRHMESLLQLFSLKKVLKTFRKKYTEKHSLSDINIMYLNKICKELMHNEIVAYASKKYSRIKRKK